MLYVNVTSVESYISPDRTSIYLSIYLSSEPPSPALQLPPQIMDGVIGREAGRQAAHL
ncbi:hypothetical protein CY35_05G120900 [Sphagnum magellanicum]|nr:hypothetical protein CY35_05G120900 [Sphagnum magellanicum]